MSAVSRKLTPSSRARWISAMEVASSAAPYTELRPMQPRPMAGRSMPVVPSVRVFMPSSFIRRYVVQVAWASLHPDTIYTSIPVSGDKEAIILVSGVPVSGAVPAPLWCGRGQERHGSPHEPGARPAGRTTPGPLRVLRQGIKRSDIVLSDDRRREIADFLK